MFSEAHTVSNFDMEFNIVHWLGFFNTKNLASALSSSTASPQGSINFTSSFGFYKCVNICLIKSQCTEVWDEYHAMFRN